MPTARIGDASIHYREAGGGGDAVVLIHAFPLSSAMWEPQLKALAGRFRVVAPDIRGLGRSRPAPEATTMELVAQDVAALLRSLGIRRAAVCGCSMGGYAALALARLHPGLVSALALCDTRAGADQPEGRAGRETFARNALDPAKGLAWVNEDFAPKLLRPTPDPAILARVREIALEGSPEGVAAAQRGMGLRRDSMPFLSRIEVPTLVVVGEEDQLTPPPEAKTLQAGIRGSRLAIIPGAGHLPNLEAPEAFNRILSGFLAGATAPPLRRPGPFA